MKLLFNFIKARIQTEMPEIKTIRLWNSQFLYARGDKYYFGSKQNERYRTEKAFQYPACFIEFITLNVYNRAMGLKDIELIVRFRLGLEGYNHERLETLDFVDSFTDAIQLMAPTEASGLIFNTFQKVSTDLDYDHDNVEEPVLDFRTLYRSTAGYWYKNAPTIPSVNIDIPISDTDTIVPEV